MLFSYLNATALAAQDDQHNYDDDYADAPGAADPQTTTESTFITQY